MPRPHLSGTPAPASLGWLVLLTACTMVAFAANSLLARLALQTTPIDPSTFTAVRLGAGALTLAALMRHQGLRLDTSRRGWWSGLLLFVYAAGFSHAYRGLDTGTGALVLFASAQLLMMAVGWQRGERPHGVGALLALAGLVVFLAPGASPTAASHLVHAALMLAAGLAWGGFSVLGKSAGQQAMTPLAATGSSFVLATPLALGLLAWESLQGTALHAPPLGVAYAVLSGCVTSALGYVLWYWVRQRMATQAAGTVQLSVPVLSALMGLAWLGETMGLRQVLAGGVVLMGVALAAQHGARQRRG
ncbi:DMT family transporter [Aquabacterium sp. A3]|uniref:DMT family transporter n=1 Tax=Aquabacterium sp. A3 TaxID=3132829 RepID=UPI003119AC5A